MSTPNWLLPWAKLGRSADKVYPRDAHPVACHLLDVANVAHVLWTDCLAASVRTRWAAALGLSEEDAARWIAFWAGCHDIGKACPGFQKLDCAKNAHRVLDNVGLTVGCPTTTRHDHVSAYVLRSVFQSHEVPWPPIDLQFANALAAVIGGHHGVIPTSMEYGKTSFNNSQLGNAKWSDLRCEILTRLAEAVDVGNRPAPVQPTGSNCGFYLVLAGLISVADWIGSNQKFFKPVGIEIDWNEYCERSAEQAQLAVESLGWTGWQPDRTSAGDFRSIFPQHPQPRPLQEAVECVVNSLSGPAMLIVEAPMGEGKTEAALYAADRHTHERGGRGMYVALPTTATSNGMFNRVTEYLQRRYKHGRTNVQLLHGRTFLSSEYEDLRLAAIAEDQEEVDGRVVAEEWFAKDKKQGMLAPFAVGTIDQALLSVLQTRFGFVRLFGLAGKTVILDEVHAYDAYTSTIMGRMLAWLGALGCPVVLLSATLPRETRRRLIAEYLHFDPDHAIDVSVEDDATNYPRMTTADPVTKSVAVETFEADQNRKLTIKLHRIRPETFADRLVDALTNGGNDPAAGTAAVVCNTVGRAQELFQELSAKLEPEITVELFHARFPLGERQRIEDAVLETYGKGHTDSIRPARVLVATQVIEQSLDLDFDLMATEYAPIDLILQRVGRMHRHDRERPAWLKDNPQLWLLEPDEETEGVPHFGRFEDTVYDRNILLRSYLTLPSGEHAAINLPDDIEKLVEAVYIEDFPPPADSAWATALNDSRREYVDRRGDSRDNARGALIPKPDASNLTRQRNRDLPEEDDPRSRDSKVAKTREGDPSVSVVLLYQTDNGPSLTPDGSEPIDLNIEPRGDLLRDIVTRSVSLSHRGWVAHFAAADVPPGWRKCGPLRFHRHAILDDEGTYSAKPRPGTLHYDETLGVELRYRDA